MKQTFAQVDISKLFEIKPGQGIGDASQFNSIGSFISTVLPNIYVFAGLILLFFLIFGGLTVILGAGKGKEDQAKKGKEILTYTLFGFLIVFASYWIIQIIEIVTGIPIL